MNNVDVVKRGIVGTLVIALFILAFLILKPIIVAIIFGLLFAYMFSPLYKKIYSKLKRKNLSALLIIVGLIVLFAIPIIYIVPNLVNQTFNAYISFQNLDLSETFNSFGESELINSIANNINGIVGQLFSSLISQFTDLLVDLPSMVLQFAVFLFTFFFATRDSIILKSYVSDLSPFSKRMEKKIMNEFRDITNAIVLGQVLVGIIQGLLLGIGMFVAGVPNVLTLTFLACIVSIIPLVGAWIVWLPVGIFMLVNAHIVAGIFLLAYGMFFVSTIDNFLRPYILSRRSSLPIPVSIIGTIGGLYFFGISGLLLGPLILAYVLIIIEFYQKGRLNELFHGK